MKSFNVFVKDLVSSIKSPMKLVTLIAILIIPIMYTGMFLSAFWDPYERLNDIPVAVVNNDTGAEYEGKTLEVGNELVKELQNSDDFMWEFVNEEEAEKGLEEDRYYIVITIPDNFSEKATTVLDDQPEPANLTYIPNEGYNFLASQIGGSAIKQLESKISAKVSEAYVEVLFDQLETVASGFNEAGEGATKLSEGATKLDDGAGQLKENLAKLVEGTVQLAGGITPLREGATQLEQGAVSLKDGSLSLEQGLSQLLAAQQQLQDGAVKAQQGGQQLHEGLKSSEAGSAQLDEGLQASLAGTSKLQGGITSTMDGMTSLENGLKSSEAGSAQLKEGLASAQEGSGQVATGAKTVYQGLQQLMASNSELANNTELQKLVAASKAVADGSEELHQGQQQLAEGASELHQAQTQLVQGAGQLAAGSKELNQGATQLLQGTEQLVTGASALHQGQQQLLTGMTELQAGQTSLSDGLQLFGEKMADAVTGSQQLTGGAEKIADGSAALSGGMSQLGEGVDTISSGSVQLDAGAGELKNGLSELKEGSGELASKLTEAADKTGGLDATDDNFSMFAQPVKVDEVKHNEVPNYGTGFAPFMMSLGLFIGALIATVIFPVRESTVAGATGMNRFVSRTLFFVLVSVIQSLISSIVMLYVLGIEVQSVPMFYGFTFITSLVFMMIIQALVTCLDQAGRFIAIILLILQLTASAGTFPIELVPGAFQFFNPFLPMTYAIKGYKAVISTGDAGMMWQNAGILAIFSAVFLIFTLLYFIISTKNKSAQHESSAAV